MLKRKVNIESRGGAEKRLLEKTKKRIKDGFCPAKARRRKEKRKI